MANRLIVSLLAMAGIVIAAGSPVRAQDNTELLQRLERLDNQVRSLTAMVEELTFRVADLEELVEILQADNEALYQILAAAGIDPYAVGDAVPGADPPAVAPPVDQPAAVADAGQPESGQSVPAQPQLQAPADPPQGGGPLDLAGVLRPDGGLNLDADAPAAADDPGAAAPAEDRSAISGDASADYNAAYQLVLNGDYEQAGSAFSDFLAAYPGNALVPDAQFWLAESMLSRGMYREAATAFYDAYVANPAHDKAPDMLLKLGISLAALGQTESACGTFEQVLQRYPDAPNALIQRVADEQANAGC